MRLGFGTLCAGLVIAACGVLAQTETETGNSLREKSVLVWDGAAGVITRTLRVWDDAPELEREFAWLPADPDAPGLFDGGLTGSGRIEWRLPPAPGDIAGVLHEIYAGRLEDGRPHGRGVLLTASGSRYDGDFRHGLFDGDGTLRLPTGTVYSGEFKNGLPNGTGRLTLANGDWIDGAFEDGRIAGGAALPDFDYRTSLSRAGDFGGSVATDPDYAISLLPAQSSTSAVEVRVYTDGARYMHEASEPGQYGLVGYTQEQRDGKLVLTRAELQPGRFDMFDVLRGSGSSTARDSELTFLPAFLVGDFVNRGNRALQVERAYLLVERSQPDLQPFPVVSSIAEGDGCGWDYGITNFNTRINIDNYGAGPMRGARMDLRFASRQQPMDGGSRPIYVELGDFNDYQSIPVFGLLREMGVNTGALQIADPNCPENYDYGQCAAAVASRGIFGEITPHLFMEGRFVMAAARGNLSYAWLTADGESRFRTSTFDVAFPIYGFVDRNMAECGAGGPIGYSGRAIELDVDRDNYFINLTLPPDVRVLQPQQNVRVGLVLDAPGSSIHDFRMVLEMSDGSRAISQPINLNVFYLRREKSYPPEWYHRIQ